MSRFATGSAMRRAAENTVVPAMRISPSSGISRPATLRSVVVLPQPDGPRRVKNSPSATCSATSRTANASGRARS
jgi:hypothetical protein